MRTGCISPGWSYASSFTLVVPAQTLEVTRDPDDNRILECALAAGSDCIVTYDQDLLRLGEYGGIMIVTAVDFLRRVTEP